MHPPQLYVQLMATESNMSARSFELDEIPDYLHLLSTVQAGSGIDGSGHSHAYSKSDPFDAEAGRDREITRWTTTIDRTGWRRAWGLFSQEEPVGHLNLVGGTLGSELHRISMGMGILRPYRRNGGGTRLLETAIRWAQQQPSIAWVDLGVFSDNPGAQALYERQGFEVVGRTLDRFRVDGESLDEISMTLNVSSTR